MPLLANGVVDAVRIAAGCDITVRETAYSQVTVPSVQLRTRDQSASQPILKRRPGNSALTRLVVLPLGT